jgi:Flp pilus assembly protein TadD
MTFHLVRKTDMTASMPDTQALAALDAEELFTLGVRASRANDDGAALAYLKLAAAKDPSHAEAHWLLGAEYASVGMPDRARPALQRAVELKPELHTARFQWGLLQLTSGLVDEAQAIWKPLDLLADEDPLRLFKTGLLLMVQDHFDEALQMVEQAMNTPSVEAAMRADMAMVVDQIKEKKNAAPATAVEQAAKEALAESHFALSAYQRGLSDKKH